MFETVAPVWACLLIGGQSRRMGSPKHLLPGPDGCSWLERTVAVITPVVEGIVLAGAGVIPESLTTLPRLDDAAGAAGPLAGVLAALRWQPESSWLVVACDMPCLERAAVDWLLASRHPGLWGVVPRLAAEQRVQPLLAWYAPASRVLFEEMRQAGQLRLSSVADHPAIATPVIPGHLAGSWQNINTPEELTALTGKAEKAAPSNHHLRHEP